MSQFCPNCGARAAASQRFCRACGASLAEADETTAETPTQEQPPETPVQAAPPPPPPAPTPPAAAQPPAPKPGATNTKKGLLAGGGLLVIVVVVAAVFVFLLGGGDNDAIVEETAALMSPSLFESGQTDLSDAIASLNQAQLKTAQDLMAQDASLQQDVVSQPDARNTPEALDDLPPPEEVADTVDENLRQAAASAAQVADVAANLASTTRSYDGGSENAAQMAQQYDAVAQKALEQLLEIQNWREQYLRGIINAQQVLINIASAGATFWNPAVTLPGVTGNPFVNILDPYGVTFPGAPVLLPQTSVTTITTQVGASSLGLWVSTSSQTVTRTVAVPVDPIPSFFNPYDPGLVSTLVTAQGQVDYNLVRRWVLARLDRYRYPFPGTTTPVVVVDNFTYFNPSTSPAVQIGGPVYVNRLLGAVPDVGGSVIIRLTGYEGIAIAGAPSLSAGVVPVFNGGRVVTFARTPSVPTVSLISIGPNGAPTFVNRIDVVPLTRSAVSIQIDNLSATFVNVQGSGVTAQNVFNVTTRVSYSSLLSSFTLTCFGASPIVINGGSGTVTVSLGSYAVSPGKDVPVLCTADAFSQTYATAAKAFPYAARDNAATRDQQLGQIDTVLSQVYFNEYAGAYCGRNTQGSVETQGSRPTQTSVDWISGRDTQSSVDWVSGRNTQSSRAWIGSEQTETSTSWASGNETQSSTDWITSRNTQGAGNSCATIPVATATATPTNTPTPKPGATSTPTPTNTPGQVASAATATSVPAQAAAPTATSVPPTATPVPPTATHVPPTATATQVHYTLSASLNKSQYAPDENFQVCYQLSPANVTFEVRLYESINGGPYGFQTSLQSNPGGGCTSAYAWDHTAGSRALLLEAYVNGVKAAETVVYATVVQATPQWTHVLSSAIQHNQSYVDITGLHSGSQYRVCLNGTIGAYVSSHNDQAYINPQQAYMQVGSIYLSYIGGYGYCADFTASGTARVHCDGSRFVSGPEYWGTFGGAFSIDVYQLV